MMGPVYLEKILAREDLTRAESSELMGTIMSGEMTDVQIAGTLIAMRAKGVTVDEIAGFAGTMRDRALRVSPKRTDCIDTCGTGGDGAQTFNISTACALVAAGAGIGIAKHGNRAISSKCGSSDVLDALGVVVVPAERVAEVIDRVGIGFMFAPAHHPATRHAVTARRELGVRTIFNLLGPLTNPAFVKRQIMGIFDGSLTETAAQVLATLGSEKVFVVHGLDGSDEVSIVADTKVTVLSDGNIETFTFNPESVGIAKAAPDTIAGGSPDENAAMITAILDGKAGPRHDAVVLNAAFAIRVAGATESVEQAVAVARESIASGAARDALERLKTVSAEVAS